MKAVLALALIAPLAACASSGGMPLLVESNPAGASVSTSAGASCASTPCTLNVSADRDFTVTVSMNGYEPATQNVTLATSGGSNSTVAGMLSGGQTSLMPNPVRVALQPAAQSYSAYPAPAPNAYAPPQAYPAPQSYPAPQAYAAPPPAYAPPQAAPAYSAPQGPATQAYAAPPTRGGAPLGTTTAGAPPAYTAPVTQGAPLQTPPAYGGPNYAGPNSRAAAPQSYTAPAYTPPAPAAYAPPPATAYAPPQPQGPAYAPPAPNAYAAPAPAYASPQQSYAPTPYPPQAHGAPGSCRLTTENVSGGGKTCLYTCNGQPVAVAVGANDQCAFTINR